MPQIRNNKKKLADCVLDEIKRMLIQGELKEGDKLPNQDIFAKQLGVSRAPLREAIHTLQLMRVVEQKPGAGTIILSGNPQQWAEKPDAPILSDPSATLELLEARKSVEIKTMQLAATRISRDEIRELRTDLIMMKASRKNNKLKEYLKNDMSFHFHIANASHNRYLIHMVATIRELMEQFMLEVFETIPVLLDDSMDFHLKIFEALNQKDVQAAMEYMEAHLASIETMLKRYYSEKGLT